VTVYADLRLVVGIGDAASWTFTRKVSARLQ
jgi:hypothetical protein